MAQETPGSVSLEVRLFGAFAAYRNGRPIAGLHRRKGERLLAYLALRAGQWADTRRLAADLWSGKPDGTTPPPTCARASPYLRQLLEADAACLESRPGAVCLRLQEEQADTLRFEAACGRGDPAPSPWPGRISEEPLPRRLGTDAWIGRVPGTL